MTRIPRTRTARLVAPSSKHLSQPPPRGYLAYDLQTFLRTPSLTLRKTYRVHALSMNHAYKILDSYFKYLRAELPLSELCPEARSLVAAEGKALFQFSWDIISSESAPKIEAIDEMTPYVHLVAQALSTLDRNPKS